MRVEIFKSLPKPGEWAPMGAMFSFLPVDGATETHCAILVPDRWLMVGEPESMLVCRVEDTNVFVTLSATEAIMAALLGTHGFTVDPRTIPQGIRLPNGIGTPEILTDAPELPAPKAGRNGRAPGVPARRR